MKNANCKRQTWKQSETAFGRASAVRVCAVLLIVLVVPSCQYDPYAHLFTTQKPKAADVVGHFVLTEQTIVTGGLSAMNGKRCYVDLRPDGTFDAANIPPFDGATDDFANRLVSGSGTWQIAQVGSVGDGTGTLKAHWGISFSASGVSMRSAGLTGNRPPYGLIFTIGDPDSGDVMILTKR
jgi:hypothetical protein